MRDIKRIVRDYIVENLLMGGAPEEVERAASFLTIGVLDSTGVVELVSFLERTTSFSAIRMVFGKSRCASRQSGPSPTGSP